MSAVSEAESYSASSCSSGTKLSMTLSPRSKSVPCKRSTLTENVNHDEPLPKARSASAQDGADSLAPSLKRLNHMYFQRLDDVSMERTGDGSLHVEGAQHLWFFDKLLHVGDVQEARGDQVLYENELVCS